MAGVYKNMQDLTVVYYTANKLPEKFHKETRRILRSATSAWIICIAQKPMEAWSNTLQYIDYKPSHLNIYRQALEGAKLAQTKYIALCEDDMLYHSDHFNFRPKEGHFGYNMNVWSIFTWVKPAIFNYKDRINLSGLICERDLFIEAMEERFAKFPDASKTPIESWAEPGKYEKNLGITERKIEKFYPDNPNVAFSHETALAFLHLGKRKKMGQPRALAIPYWGKAEDTIKLYV